MSNPYVPPNTRCKRCNRRNDNHNVRHRFETDVELSNPWERIAELEAENRQLCVFGAEPTDEEWIALRAKVAELEAEVERLRKWIEEHDCDQE